jgi:L-seryl-tRNA(Ser) seleniumtransferase
LPRADKATALLRTLPGVDALVTRVAGHAALAGIPRRRLTEAAREVLAAERRRVIEGASAAAAVEALAERVVTRLSRSGVFSLARVVNATGVVLHTNLGRALLSPLARERLQGVAGAYSNLEMDVSRKERGSRYAHVDALLQRLTGAEASLVVNNCASAVLLALESLARGKEVIVSRGELIEIGGEFRIPDIMRRSGATLREVGTTNRTHLKDYAQAIGPETGLLLKVHTSNYRVVGFTAAVSSRELAELGRERGVPVMEDLGSGCLVDLRRFGFPYEPTVPEVVASGVDLVSFSGDKLLGGPQAGLVVGKASLIGRLAQNPLNRALRVDKLTVAALEATLYAYEAGDALETIPTLRMLTEAQSAIRRRARGLLRPSLARDPGASRCRPRWTRPRRSVAARCRRWSCRRRQVALGTRERPAQVLDEHLRNGQPPVLGRVVDDRLLLDFRTILPSDVPALAAALAAL